MVLYGTASISVSLVIFPHTRFYWREQAPQRQNLCCILLSTLRAITVLSK